MSGPYHLTSDELRLVLDALDVAADYRRDRAATCPDCDARADDLCGTCDHRLAVADEYDQLAASNDHMAEHCKDELCPRLPCRMFHAGYRKGWDEGYQQGWFEGEAAGFATGYAAGMPSGGGNG